MLVLLNGLFLGQESTGSGQYTAQLLRALRALDGENEYVVVGQNALSSPLMKGGQGGISSPLVKGGQGGISSPLVKGGQGGISSPLVKGGQGGISSPPRKGGQGGISSPFVKGGISNLRKLYFEQITFPRACRRARADVAHVPYWASPYYATVPTVVTVHDLIPMLLPLYRGSLLVRLYTGLVAASARRAAFVITDSLASQADIIAHLHIPAERVQAIYLAADPACRPVTDAAALAAVRERYGLPERYILYLGGFDQRKNLGALLAAYARLRAALGGTVPALVVAGRLPEADRPLFPAPRRLARELGVEDAVRFTGWVAEEDKPPLYSGALFFAFLSLYEGFGLMPLEAMACGTPVLAARRSSLPEVVGDGGLLVDPCDVEAIAAAMASLLQDGALRAHLRERALAQASRFTWRRTAEETLAVYERIHHPAK